MHDAKTRADFWYQDGDMLYPVTISRRATARRLSIRFDPVTHEIRVSAPTRTSKKQVEQGLHRHAEWLAGRIAERLAPVPFAIGADIPLEGQIRILCHDDRPRRHRPPGAWRMDEHALYVTGNINHFGRRCQDAVKDLAANRARHYIDHYCAILGQRPGKITMRDTGSRWGSCTAKGDFNLSWRLIFAPAHVFDYVAAHEAAHLIHRDHSPQFWQVVGQICPNEYQAKKWLKHYGQTVFCYGATSASRHAC